MTYQVWGADQDETARYVVQQAECNGCDRWVACLAVRPASRPWVGLTFYFCQRCLMTWGSNGQR